MQCLYATGLKRGHPRAAIKIDICLTNGLVFNFDNSNGDGHVTISIEPADDVMTMTVAAVSCVAFRTGAAD